MSKPALVIMAAGMGSRYGGLKQVDKITEAGEIILDFSLYDAMMAGFDRAVFVIREEHRDIFREIVDERAGRFMKIEYAYQDLEDIPEGCEIPAGREKPWGTSHAIYACRKLIDGPFLVINADDYYGPGGFVSVYEYLENAKADGAVYDFCMAGYKLENTITENGHVTRGVCEVDDEGFLKDIVERFKIQRKGGDICYYDEDGDKWVPLPEGTQVSMNFWGFTRGFIDETRNRIENFFRNEVPANPMKAEFLLPRTVDELIKEGRAKVRVLPCHDKWCGVTYKEDKQGVMDELQARKDKGEYPEKLWK
ncbi:MAG: sugar phosphate nucleotidyltransferase [Bacillota bacterium]|nr:sugar phosphate nucleotidyltransferase [Bacillota bacterium]